MASERRYLPVPDALVGERADAALARLLGLSRSKAADLLDERRVYVGAAPLARSARLTADMFLDVEIPAPEVKPDMVVAGLRICHEDEDIIVVDKPAGIAAHASSGWEGPNVVGSLRASGFRISGLGPEEREGIVHRLDVGTSGLMVVAKSARAYTHLKAAFKHRDVEKRYLALAQGHVDPPVGTIDAPIAHHGGKTWKMAIRSDGKPAITHYEVTETLPGASLIDVNLETGRTHQIRVHFQAIKHPLVGDLTYGANPRTAAALGLERQWLHAYRLAFTHPNGSDAVFTSDPAPDLTAALTDLREGKDPS